MPDWLILAYFVLIGRIFLAGASEERALPTILDDPIIGSEKGAIHVVISTECFNSYFVYQALAMKYTFDKVGQPGKITRVVSCDEDEAKEKLTDEDLAIMDTLVVPNWKQHPTTGDHYQPYNRPVSIMFWLAERLPTAEWTLILDPDMILKQPFLVKDFGVPEGFAVSAHYNRLLGVNNALADRHIPDVPRKEDHYGGPSGRRADEAGSFFLLRTRDLAKIAPLWLSYTEAVREDPDAWNLTGDPTVQKGGKTWISEMYGYAFAAAKVGIRHKIETTVEYYPGYAVKDIPIIVHYGLKHKVANYTFDKHEHFDFDPLRCPPWNMSEERSTAEDFGLFPHPPHPKSVRSKEPRERYSQLLVIEVVNTINKALCERHRRSCIDQKEAVEEQCVVVDKIEKELNEVYAYLHIPGVICHDDHEFCLYWRQRQECDNTWMYMRENCRASCEICRPYVPSLSRLSNYSQADAFVISQSDAQRLEAMEKIRCLHLGLDRILNDTRCRVFVARGDIKPDNFRQSRLQLTGPLETSSLYFPAAVTGVAIVAFALYLFTFISRPRRKKAQMRLQV